MTADLMGLLVAMALLALAVALLRHAGPVR